MTTACTNDESSDFIENNPIIQQSSKKPLDYTYQTQEEVNRRLAEINARYNTNWCAPESLAPNKFNEEFFVSLENYLKEKEEASLDNTQE